jgi:hypothetical protein
LRHAARERGSGGHAGSQGPDLPPRRHSYIVGQDSLRGEASVTVDLVPSRVSAADNAQRVVRALGRCEPPGIRGASVLEHLAHHLLFVFHAGPDAVPVWNDGSCELFGVYLSRGV